MSQIKDARKTKNILIDPAFQIKMLSYFVGIFFVTTLSLYSTTFLFFWRLKTKALNLGIPKEHVFFNFLSNQKYELDMLFIGLALFNFILLIVVGFIISHRIAGPLYNLKRYLSSASAESSDFKLRSSDFFKELEPIVNNLKEKFKD